MWSYLWITAENTDKFPTLNPLCGRGTMPLFTNLDYLGVEVGIGYLEEEHARGKIVVTT